MTYSVGILTSPQKDDERFDELEEAETKAMENSIDDDTWGVWDDKSGELLSIAYQSQVYSQ